MVLEVKNPIANAGDMRDMGVIHGSEDPLEEGIATHFQYFLLGEFHGQRSLVGYR